MSRESIEELKARLLSDSEVQMMIRMRAYEVYLMRGGQPGSQAEDWFRAEFEVLSFLIEEENRRALEEATEAQAETVAGIELVASASETGDPETSGGDWLPAPATAPKKRTRATTATASKKASVGATKKTASAAKKTTATRAASKKTSDATEKPKRSRKKAEDTATPASE